MKSWIFIFSVLLITYAGCYGTSDIYCVVGYLKDLNAVKITLDAQNNPEAKEKCGVIIRNLTEVYENDIMARLKMEDDMDCIMEIFRSHNVSDIYLKGLAFHAKNLTNVSDYKKEALETTNDILKAVQTICTADERFGKMFNDSLESHRENVEQIVDPSTQLCLKKYYFEKKIIDPVEFNIDVSTINATGCTDIVNELDTAIALDIDESLTFYGLPSVEVQKCSNKKFVDEKVVLRLTSFEVAVRLSLSESQEIKLRSEYIKWMTANVRFLLDCLETLLVA